MRAKRDDPPLEGGDILLDPTYMQNLQTVEQAKQAEAAEAEGEMDDEDIGGAVDETIDDMFKAKRRVKTAKTLLI